MLKVPFEFNSAILSVNLFIKFTAVGAKPSPIDIFKSSTALLNSAILFFVVFPISSAIFSVAPLAFNIAFSAFSIPSFEVPKRLFITFKPSVPAIVAKK